MAFLSAPAGRSSRPRPLSSSGIMALSGGTGHLLPRFSVGPLGNGDGRLGGGGGGSAGRIGQGGSADAASQDEASVKEATNPIGAATERSRSNGNTSGEIEEIPQLFQTFLARMQSSFSQVENNQTMIIKILDQMKNTLSRMENNQSTTEVLAQIHTTLSRIEENHQRAITDLHDQKRDILQQTKRL